jgi:hypothetical protein
VGVSGDRGLLRRDWADAPNIKLWSLRGYIGQLLVLTYLFAVLYPPFTAGNAMADMLRGSKDLPFRDAPPRTSVQYRATAGSNEQTRETGLRVIGTTQSFVFFYNREDTRTLVIPTDHIVEMEHDGPPTGKPKEDQ